jgi:hypothetical protein
MSRILRAEFRVDRSQQQPVRWHIIVVALAIMAAVAVVAIGQTG